MSGRLDDLLPAYVSAFETLDAGAVVPFYQLPCLFVAPKAMVFAPDSATIRGVVQHLMEQARSQGYRRTEIRGLESRRLGAELALVTGVYVRFDAAAEEVARFGFLYLLRDDAGTWRIAVAVAHEPSPLDARARP